MHRYTATKSLQPARAVCVRGLLLAVLGTALVLRVGAQDCVLHYAVTRNGAPMGQLQLRQSHTNGQVIYKLQPALKTSFVFALTVKAFEEAVFENGILTSAFVYHNVNGRVQLHTQIQAAETGYMISNRTAVSYLKKYPITYNMLCLYTTEPQRKAYVFCDAFQQFLRVVKTGLHRYRITFPDGDFNEYQYRKGTCINVRMNNTWFEAEMTLIQTD